MARRRITTWPPAAAVVAVMASAVALAWPVPAQAQPDTCPISQADSIAVTLSTPGDGERVGGVVTVKGRAVSQTEIFQVDLLVGDSRHDRLVVEPPSGSVDFELSWDAAALPADSDVEQSLTVVACGGDADQARLSRGTRRIEVTVEASAALVSPQLAGTAPNRDADRPTRRWVGAVIIIPSLAGLIYALSARSRSARKAASQ